MIKINTRPSLVFQAFWILTIGMLSIPVFHWLAQTLGDFVWPFSPWDGWLGWIAYVVVWVYAFLIWLVCYVAQYFMWFTPFVVLGYAFEVIRTHRKQTISCFEKAFLFQTRKLAGSWHAETESFGKDQLNAFLNIFHLADMAGINEKTLQLWFLLGFRHGNFEADKILETYEFEIQYPESSIEPVTMPRLFSFGKPVNTH